MKIERAKIEDVLEIKQVLSTTWHATYGDILSPETIQKVTSVWHDPKQLELQIENPNLFFAVKKKEYNQVIGLATALQDKDSVIVSKLYVLPSYQSQGVGSQFILEIQKVYPDIRKIQLYVEEQN